MSTAVGRRRRAAVRLAGLDHRALRLGVRLVSLGGRLLDVRLLLRHAELLSLLLALRARRATLFKLLEQLVFVAKLGCFDEHLRRDRVAGLRKRWCELRQHLELLGLHVRDVRAFLDRDVDVRPPMSLSTRTI